MITSIARKTFNLYTLPARLAYRQASKYLPPLQRFEMGRNHQRTEHETAKAQVLSALGQKLGLDLTSMSPEERQRQILNAGENVSYGLSLALRESLKVLILKSDVGQQDRKHTSSRDIVEGEFQRLG